MELDRDGRVLIQKRRRRENMKNLIKVFFLVFMAGFVGCVNNIIPEVSAERTLSLSELPVLVIIPGLTDRAGTGHISIQVNECGYTDRFENYFGEFEYPGFPRKEGNRWNVYFTQTNFTWFINRAKNFGCDVTNMTVTYTFQSTEQIPEMNSVTIREHITQ